MKKTSDKILLFLIILLGIVFLTNNFTDLNLHLIGNLIIYTISIILVYLSILEKNKIKFFAAIFLIIITTLIILI